MQNCLLRPLTPVDLEQAHQLSTTTGWNQTLADWKRLLTLQPDGCYAAFRDERLAGTVTTTEYGKTCGWIGMVLVDPAYQGGGIGKRLLQAGLDSLRAHGVATIKLDATPQGEPIYAKAGFKAEYPLERWEGIADLKSTRRYNNGLTPFDATLIEALFAFDWEHFGADRSHLLRALIREFPDYCLIHHDGQRIRGYILGRRGERANYLGPWLATEADVARHLFEALLARRPGERFFVDINPATDARAIVEKHRLQLQRPLLRMYHGPNDFSGNPATIFGIAGPEIG